MIEELPSILPASLFQLEYECQAYDEKAWKKRKVYSLAHPAGLLDELSFADLALAWGVEGIYVHVSVNQDQRRCFYPELQRGDSIELFFDTRNVKSSGFNTRFCHHFFFLPEEVDGRHCGEKTHFRTDDRHDLCDPDLLRFVSKDGKDFYEMDILIPKEALVGYNPDQFRYLGFTYRINRFRGESQHFSVSSREYKVEEQPSLWSQLKLV